MKDRGRVPLHARHPGHVVRAEQGVSGIAVRYEVENARAVATDNPAHEMGGQRSRPPSR